MSGTKHFYWVPLYGIRSFHASFHHFSQCFFIRQITVKASNDYSNVYSFGNTLVWIGLDDKAVESIFRWVSGHPLYYVAWGPVEPNLAEKENCAGIHDVSILNAPCTWTLPSLCSTTGIESVCTICDRGLTITGLNETNGNTKKLGRGNSTRWLCC